MNTPFSPSLSPSPPPLPLSSPSSPHLSLSLPISNASLQPELSLLNQTDTSPSHTSQHTQPIRTIGGENKTIHLTPPHSPLSTEHNACLHIKCACVLPSSPSHVSESGLNRSNSSSPSPLFPLPSSHSVGCPTQTDRIVSNQQVKENTGTSVIYHNIHSNHIIVHNNLNRVNPLVLGAQTSIPSSPLTLSSNTGAHIDDKNKQEKVKTKESNLTVAAVNDFIDHNSSSSSLPLLPSLSFSPASSSSSSSHTSKQDKNKQNKEEQKEVVNPSSSSPSLLSPSSPPSASSPSSPSSPPSSPSSLSSSSPSQTSTEPTNSTRSVIPSTSSFPILSLVSSSSPLPCGADSTHSCSEATSDYWNTDKNGNTIYAPCCLLKAEMYMKYNFKTKVKTPLVKFLVHYRGYTTEDDGHNTSWQTAKDLNKWDEKEVAKASRFYKNTLKEMKEKKERNMKEQAITDKQKKGVHSIRPLGPAVRIPSAPIPTSSSSSSIPSRSPSILLPLHTRRTASSIPHDIHSILDSTMKTRLAHLPPMDSPNPTPLVDEKQLLASLHPESTVSIHTITSAAPLFLSTRNWLPAALEVVIIKNRKASSNIQTSRVKKLLMIAIQYALEILPHASKSNAHLDQLGIKASVTDLLSIPSPILTRYGLKESVVMRINKQLHYSSATMSESEMSRIDYTIRELLRSMLHEKDEKNVNKTNHTFSSIHQVYLASMKPYDESHDMNEEKKINENKDGQHTNAKPSSPTKKERKENITSSPNPFAALSNAADDDPTSPADVSILSPPPLPSPTPPPPPLPSSPPPSTLILPSERIHSIQYFQVPSDGKCWWHSVTKGMGVSNMNILQEEMRQAVTNIQDVNTLHAIALTDIDTDGTDLSTDRKQNPEFRMSIEEIEQQLKLCIPGDVTQKFLAPTSNFSNMVWGGTKEMLSLSYARRGDIRFTTFSTNMKRHQTYHYNNKHLKGEQQTQAAKHEISLHHCNASGSYNTNVHDQHRNHWCLFQYIMHDGSTLSSWPYLDRETPDEIIARHALIQAKCIEGDNINALQAKKKEDKQLAQILKNVSAEEIQGQQQALAMFQVAAASAAATKKKNEQFASPTQLKQQTPPSSASKLPVPPPSATAASVNQQLDPASPKGVTPKPNTSTNTTPHMHYQHANNTNTHQTKLNFNQSPMNKQNNIMKINHHTKATAATSTVTPSSSPSHRQLFYNSQQVNSHASAKWKLHRVRAVAEIASENIPLFQHVAGALFEAYKIHSEMNQYNNCQHIANMILDLPSQTLNEGSTKQQKKWLEYTDATIAQQLHQVNNHTNTGSKQSDSAAAPPHIPADINQHKAKPNITDVTYMDVDNDEDEPSIINQKPVVTPFIPPTSSSSLSATLPSDSHTPSLSAVSAHDDAHTDSAADLTDNVRRAVRIIRAGGPHSLSRAARALSNASLAPMNATTKQKLRLLHPQAFTTMSPLPAHRASGIIDFNHLGRVLKRRVHNGSAAGPSGWSGSHLMLIWEGPSTDAATGLKLFIRDICNGVFTNDVKQRLLACNLVPIAKKDGGVRPVAVGEVFTKCAAHCAMAIIEEDMHHFFPSIQYGVRKSGGSETAAQLIRATIQQSLTTSPNNTIALKTDFRNAFNTVSRARVWNTLLAHSHAGPILKSFYWQYADASPLLVYDGGKLFDEIRSSEGVRQGCPFAAFGFALCVQTLYEQALKAQTSSSSTDQPQLNTSACKGISIQDDFTIIGPADQVMKVYDYILQHAHEFGLELQPQKCQVYIPPMEEKVDTAAATATPTLTHIHSVCYTRKLTYSHSMESLGVMFGSNDSIEEHCTDTVSASKQFFTLLTHPEMPTQCAWSLLRSCAIPKLGFLARTTHPDRLDESAQQFDQLALDTALTLLKHDHQALSALEKNQQEEEKDDGRISIVTKDQLIERMRLPISAGGLGLRSIHSIRHASYFSSMLQMLPEFLQLHPHLQSSNSHYQTTDVYKELEECRQHLLSQGAGNRHQRRSVQQPTLIQLLHRQSPDPPPIPPPPSINRSLSAPLTHIDHNQATSTVPASSSTHSPMTQSDSSSPLPALHKSIDETWRSGAEYAKSATENKTAAAKTFPIARKLQNQLTAGIELTKARKLYNASSRYQQTILTCIGKNTDCSSFLTVLPTRKEYIMRNEQFILAIRHRLGMLPYTDLINEICIPCRSRNKTMPTFMKDPDHLHACILETGGSVSERHDAIVQTLATLARSAGYSVKIEPSFEPTLHTVDINNDDGNSLSQTTTVADNQRRGDLLLIKHNERILVDVSIRRPTAPTIINDKGSEVNVKPLAAAAVAEKQKHDKYDEDCKRNGLTMVPFVMETYGAKGKEAAKLLLKLADQVEDVTPQRFLTHASAVLSVSLQSGNALIAAKGTQRLRVQQQMNNDSVNNSGRTLPSRRQQIQRQTSARNTSHHSIPSFHAHYHSATHYSSNCHTPLKVSFNVDELQADTTMQGYMEHDRTIHNNNNHNTIHNTNNTIHPLPVESHTNLWDNGMD